MSSNTSNFYKEAITKLRYLLSDPDSQQTTRFDNDDEKKNDDTMKNRQITQLNEPVPQQLSSTEEPTHQRSELTNFTQQLQLYLRHLQEERNFLRDEISTLVSKVMEIILENDHLRQNQMYHLPLMKSTASISEFDYDGTENSDYRNVGYSENYRDRFSEPIRNSIWNNSGYKVASPSQRIVDINPNGRYRNDSTIYHESRISELQAHLTKTKMQLNKALNELEWYKRKEKKQDKQRCENIRDMKEQHYEQIEMLHSANREINDIIAHLQLAAYNLPANQVTTMMIRPTQKVPQQNNLASTDQPRFEKLQEVEREYGDQIEKLLAELQEQWNKNSQLKTQISGQKQTELELRQELTRRSNSAQDTMKELNTKIYELETELSTTRAGKESSEHEMVNARMQLEQANYRMKLNETRYQEMIADLKQQLYRTEMETTRSREENVRLRERISSLEKELQLTIIAKEELDSQQKNNQQQLTNIIYNMDDKHGKQVSNLENRMQSQSQLIDSLKEECRMLTGKQDEQENRHKEEIAGLQNNVEYLNNKINYDIIQAENTWNDETNYPMN